MKTMETDEQVEDEQVEDDPLIESIKNRHPTLTDEQIEEEMAVIGF